MSSYDARQTLHRARQRGLRVEELELVQEFVDRLPQPKTARTIASVELPGAGPFPIWSLRFGCEDPKAPVLCIVGGVHGIERIGIHVILAFLETLLTLNRWDRRTASRLDSCRVVVVPIANPGGVALTSRSTPSGVDIMRNAPVEALDSTPFLVGGHRISRRLPWYRGPADAPMEPETRALCELAEAEIFGSEVAVSLDVHSGFGLVDRIWYPYAKAAGAFPNTREAQRLGDLLDQTYPCHIYRFEAQAASYTTHGDLWDYLYDRHNNGTGDAAEAGFFLPLTLEIGSWAWVRKNPRQLLRRGGLFNPLLPHRHERALRRHLALLEFLLRAVDNPAAWLTSS